MTAPITCASILALARAALEDDKAATPGPWPDRGLAVRRSFGSGPVHYALPCGAPNDDEEYDARFIAAARTREPELARWVERVLGDVDLSNCDETTAEALATVHEWRGADAKVLRHIAALFLRAADEVERER